MAGNIGKPLPFDELEIKPPLPPLQRLSDDIQQVLSLLSGYNGSQRKLIKVTPKGDLFIASPPVKGIANIVAADTVHDWQGGNISTTEVLIIAVPNNSNRVWVNVDSVAAPDTGYPLDAGDWVRWSIANLNRLHIHIVTIGEKAVIVYTI